MKSVLISIRSKWCEKIANGQKTIEVRKTRPKLSPPFKCYIYCSKAKERLVGILRDGDENYGEIYHGKTVFIKTGEGSVCDAWGKRQKVIGEFTCDAITRVNLCGFWDDSGKQLGNRLKETCLTSKEFCDYLGEKVGYGWHISNLKIYDTPRELSEFTGLRETRFGAEPVPITRPPQSWCYVEEQTWKD